MGVTVARALPSIGNLFSEAGDLFHHNGLPVIQSARPTEVPEDLMLFTCDEKEVEVGGAVGNRLEDQIEAPLAIGDSPLFKI